MKRALVIEDNQDNMVLITRLLQKAGYQTLEAITGREGFEMALRERPDFILLDIQLPDIPGTEVLKLIRESEIGVSIPVIAVTSFAMSGDRERLLESGCDGYLEKPIDPKLIIQQVKKIIGEG
jgi:CheY-like chemotaxis protein